MKSIVKITISMPTCYHLMDETIYFRTGTPDFLTRWQWFFDYIAARVKVDNPHRKVVVTTGPQDCMLGEEWHQYRREVLIKTRTSKLKKLMNSPPQDDLFGFSKEDNEAKIAKVKADLEALERDEYPIPEFPEYINKIKKYINGKEDNQQLHHRTEEDD